MLLDQMFVVGGSGHSTSELLDFYTWQWEIMQPYTGVRTINLVKIVSFQNSFHVFGGFINEKKFTDNIMKFENRMWSKVGKLYTARADYSTFLMNGNVYIVGGKGKSYNDICKLGDIVTCERIQNRFLEVERPVLYGFRLTSSCNQRELYNIKNDMAVVLLKSNRNDKK